MNDHIATRLARAIVDKLTAGHEVTEQRKLDMIVIVKAELMMELAGAIL